MTRHTRYAVTYGAVVALASALVAPSAAFAAPDATGGEVTPAAQQRPQAATQKAKHPSPTPNLPLLLRLRL